MQSLFPATLAFTVLSRFLILVRSQKQKAYSPFKGQEANCQPSWWCMMCVGGDSLRNVNSLRGTESIMQGGRWGNVSTLPFWELEHFPLHIYWQLHMEKLKKHDGSGRPHRRPHPLAAGQVFVCVGRWGGGVCSRGSSHFPMTGKGDDSTDWT